jgi:arylsulfatase A-like enzyme
MTAPFPLRAFGPLVVLALALPIPACGGDGDAAGERHNLLIVTLDTLRADHLGAYGYPLDTTPVLDGLAERGVLFENVYAPMPQTLPSHATIMTGLDPRQHGALENSYTLDPRLETLAEMLRARGYATAAYVGALALDRATGIDQGFDVYDQPAPGYMQGLPGPAEREADEVTELALAWADDHDSESPFLLWVHYYDPHFEHVAPRRYQRQVPPPQVRDEVVRPRGKVFGKVEPKLVDHVWHGYASEVRYTDACLGKLLDGLEERGLLDDTVIAVVGDHGEGLFQHRIRGHGRHVWEELLRVPLLLLHPDGESAGTRVKGRVVLRDVLPTLLHLVLGVEGELVSEDRGLDMWALLEQGRSLPDRPVFLERPHYSLETLEKQLQKVPEPGFLTAVILGSDKLVRLPDGTQMLYDLAQDPGEQFNIAERQPDRVTRLAALLDHWLETNEVGPPGSQQELSDERIEALKALGYLGDG